MTKFVESNFIAEMKKVLCVFHISYAKTAESMTQHVVMTTSWMTAKPMTLRDG
jgi:hypothetical protein